MERKVKVKETLLTALLIKSLVTTNELDSNLDSI